MDGVAPLLASTRWNSPLRQDGQCRLEIPNLGPKTMPIVELAAWQWSRSHQGQLLQGLHSEGLSHAEEVVGRQQTRVSTLPLSAGAGA